METRVPYISLQDLAPYNFSYKVDNSDDSKYSRSQKSDGEKVIGTYRVALPDGRIQIVNYSAGANGYVAQVTYEGEAQYPTVKP